ncbi:MAG: DUF86 domain-containing protein [Flavobacteriaceae bacterium]
MPKSDIVYLKHINQEAGYILKFIEDKTEEEFYEDELLKRAIMRSLEIIGEATKRVGIDFRLKYNTISWSEMAKMRDRIIHHYEGVDYEIVWNTITNDIPELNFRIEEILKQHK